MIRSFGNSFKNLFRNGWMTFSAVTSVTIVLSLVGFFVAILLNTERIATGIENNVRINAYLAVDSTDKHEKIEKSLKGTDGVVAVNYLSKDDQLEELKQSLGDNWATLEGDENPLSDAYVVEVKSASQVKPVAEKIKSIDGIDEVDYGGSDSDKLFQIAKFIRLWGFIGVGFFVLVAILLISNTVRLTIIAQRKDIEIMRLVGAKNSYIRGPFFFEGAWVGLLGTILPGLAIFFAYRYVYDAFTPTLVQQHLSLYSPTFFTPLLIGGLLLIGMLIGAFGSILAMGRYLKV